MILFFRWRIIPLITTFCIVNANLDLLRQVSEMILSWKNMVHYRCSVWIYFWKQWFANEVVWHYSRGTKSWSRAKILIIYICVPNKFTSNTCFLVDKSSSSFKICSLKDSLSSINFFLCKKRRQFVSKLSMIRAKWHKKANKREIQQRIKMYL